MGLNVGIDFGTSNSGVAIYRDGQVQLLPLDEKNLVPEVVKTVCYITKDHQVHIGQEAVELYYKHNVNRRRNYVKKRVGEIEVRGADMFFIRDVYIYVDELTPGRLLQFIKTALRSENFTGTTIFDRFYTTQDIVSVYLAALKLRAEKVLGETITGVTLGRPVQFSTKPDLDQKAQETLRNAACQAGFQQVDFEYEPVAAALFYETTLTRPQTALVFDFGGGTLDITIMRLGETSAGSHSRHVYASGGVDIAGSDFDRTIIRKRMLPHFGMGQVEDLNLLELINAVSDWMVLPELSVPQARLRLEKAILSGVAPARLKALEALIFNDLAFSFYNHVEATKIALSDQGAAVLELKAKDIDIWELYTRAQFEKDIREYEEQIEAILLDTVRRSGFEPSQIDAVVKTGGSSSIPLFSNALARIFGADKIKTPGAFSSVTAGLGIKAARAANGLR